MVVRGNHGRPLSWLPQARSGPSGREDGLHVQKAIRVAEGTLLKGEQPLSTSKIASFCMPGLGEDMIRMQHPSLFNIIVCTTLLNSQKC